MMPTGRIGVSGYPNYAPSKGTRVRNDSRNDTSSDSSLASIDDKLRMKLLK